MAAGGPERRDPVVVFRTKNPVKRRDLTPVSSDSTSDAALLEEVGVKGDPTPGLSVLFAMYSSNEKVGSSVRPFFNSARVGGVIEVTFNVASCVDRRPLRLNPSLGIEIKSTDAGDVGDGVAATNVSFDASGVAEALEGGRFGDGVAMVVEEAENRVDLLGVDL